MIQEGGSSQERYITSWGTEDEANAYRKSCDDEGSYRTSEPIEVPPILLMNGEAEQALYDLLERVAKAEVDYPG